jgi:hypothetical protein
MSDVWWEKWHWDRFSSEYICFPLSVSFHQYSTLSFTHTLILLEVESREAREVSKQQKAISGIGEHSIEKKNFKYDFP